ncbi:hypothetical protein A3Q56_06378 [Intoshia linei]|uniref:Uncharacterized protein n=1 Tax=Intoshia linei TaxID=1819745 RepID=A0A177AWN2_9BILA|nr:hypothetical protein A3Q56_06378 [Intoshia linei]
MASIITNTSIRKINSILKLSNNESNIPSKSALFYNINKILKTVKETLINDVAAFNQNLFLHFDGKRIIRYDSHKTEKLAVCISGENY